MLVISRTARYKYRYILQPDKPPEQHNSLLTHRDVLLMLAFAAAVSAACAVNISRGWHAATSLNLFLVQMAFCVVACPALTLAVGVQPSVFFGEYISTPRTGLLVRGLFILLCAETVFLFFGYI
jgi:hypothetical protein